MSAASKFQSLERRYEHVGEADMSTIEGTEPRSTTWAGHLARACTNHPDLTAVFESPSGRLALLLRHTLVPLMEERPAWLTETRASARRIIGDLRASGVTRKVLVVQWLEIARADDILWSWTCCYEADPIRRAQLTGLARRYVLDDLFLGDRMARRMRAGCAVAAAVCRECPTLAHSCSPGRPWLRPNRS